ncbi:hypothetical protein EMPS_11219 [Entomortierella parvispora]|uniref:Uncharacterized protein n=1 Tax=Entomortierella parvispora TaxID=205924 RepID=A0A9P3HLN4_9FUNG|nr:hypothetical protein EMPS_11219 [Entomortierella parvispora]
MANQLSLTYLPAVFTDVQNHALEFGSLVQRNIPLGDPGTLEAVSGKWARALPSKNFHGPPASPLVACLFFAIVNLQRGEGFSFKQSLENNAKAVFNVVMASLMGGAQSQDCQDLLVLCMYLKTTDGNYPLRQCASNFCVEIIGERAFPALVRMSALKLILGPAQFVMQDSEFSSALSNSIASLLRQDTFDDIEFRSTVKRIANKIGIISRDLSLADEQKLELYQYLDLVVSDPIRYTNPECMVKCMSAERWSRLLQQDLIVSFYEADHSHAMILFLESCKILGIKFMSVDDASLAHFVLQQRGIEDEALAALALLQYELRSIPAESKEQAMLHVALDARKESCPIEKLLSESATVLCVKVQKSRPDNRLLEFAEILTRYSVVAPTQYVPRLAWWLAICQRTDRDSILETGNTVQVGEVAARCLDAWLGLLLHRNEASQGLSEDFVRCLRLFSLLFPARELMTWTGAANVEDSSHSSVALFAPFLRELMVGILPIMRGNAESKAVLLAAAVVFDVLSYQVPSTVLFQEMHAIREALYEIADMIRDSPQCQTSLWRSIFPTVKSSHPFPVLIRRLDNLEYEGQSDP